MAATWRDTLRDICPSWLQGGWAEKVLYSIGVQMDALEEYVEGAVKIRFPGVHSNESLPQLSRERRIRRGPNELPETFAKRLPRWLADHATRGGPYAMLAQLYAYYDGNHFPIRLIYRSGRAFDMDVDGNVTMVDVSWSPDSEPERWARWWLIYTWPTPVPAAHVYDEVGLNYDDGSTYDTGLTVPEVYDLLVVPKEWNAAHATGNVLLINGGAVYDYPPELYDDPGLVYDGATTAEIGVS